MNKRKSPPPYTWIKAPIGWWFKGKWNKKLAHIWPGSDKKWRGTILKDDGEHGEIQVFSSEDSALCFYADMFTPKKDVA